MRQLVPMQRAMIRLKSLIIGNAGIRQEVVDLAWSELELRYRLRTVQIRMTRGKRVIYFPYFLPPPIPLNNNKLNTVSACQY